MFKYKSSWVWQCSYANFFLEYYTKKICTHGTSFISCLPEDPIVEKRKLLVDGTYSICEKCVYFHSWVELFLSHRLFGHRQWFACISGDTRVLKLDVVVMEQTINFDFKKFWVKKSKVEKFSSLVSINFCRLEIALHSSVIFRITSIKRALNLTFGLNLVIG